jgi:ElaB/YqjD/DUF883 family membrane-anchored ribosome-binding protein
MDTKNNPGNKPSGQGSGSDTVSAAKISAGTSVGSAGQPPKPQGTPAQSGTLASHTSKPMGGSTAGSGQSGGPEHLRHQDKDAGRGTSGQGASQGSGQSTTDTVRQAAQSAGETVRQAADQVQETAGDLYEQATEQAGELYDQASRWARDTYEQGSRQFESVRNRSMQSVGRTGGSIGRFVGENPVLVGIVGLAAGLLLGSLLPRTRREDETLGRWSDEVRDQGMRYARDMAHRGREFVEESFGEGDPRFASHDSDWRDERRARPGQAGRFQNH